MAYKSTINYIDSRFFTFAQGKWKVQKMTMEFLITYWLEFLFGIFSMGMIAWCKKLQSKLKKKQEEQDALKEGMRAVLHDTLFKICEKYLAMGYIPVSESEEILTRARVVYEAYSGLYGNGTGEDVYLKFKKLPIKNPIEKG